MGQNLKVKSISIIHWVFKRKKAQVQEDTQNKKNKGNYKNC